MKFKIMEAKCLNEYYKDKNGKPINIWDNFDKWAEVEINTVEDIKNLAESDESKQLVICFDREKPYILIYNDYIE